MVGGVRWRKLGTFISSVLAHLEGVGDSGVNRIPCRMGRGTTAGWKVRVAGQTDVQSWSGFINLSLCKKKINAISFLDKIKSCERLMISLHK